jgi:hypothetical protein
MKVCCLIDLQCGRSERFKAQRPAASNGRWYACPSPDHRRSGGVTADRDVRDPPAPYRTESPYWSVDSPGAVIPDHGLHIAMAPLRGRPPGVSKTGDSGSLPTRRFSTASLLPKRRVYRRT